MAEDLFPEKGDDDLIWLTSVRFGTAVAVCRQVDGELELIDSIPRLLQNPNVAM
jgi:hypothetical protein